jgi:hypothetical protein
MKTSSFITFLALSSLSFFVAPSDSKGVKRRTQMGGMGSSKAPSLSPAPPTPPTSRTGELSGMGMGMGNSKASSPSPPPPPPQRISACTASCGSIAQKSVFQCSYSNCYENFECQNLEPTVAGFKSEVDCSSYCISYAVSFCDPQGSTATSTPASRCFEARCTI